MTTRELECLGAALEALLNAGLIEEAKNLSRIMQGEKPLQDSEKTAEEE